MMPSDKRSLVRNGVGASSVTLPNKGPWSTVLEYLIERFPTIPAETWAARFAAGAVLDAAGQALSADQPFRGQARIHYYRDLAHEVPVPFAAPILFQDEYLVVADKPHFLSVMPAGQYVQETLLVRLKRATGIDTLTPMHRIDRDTAGLVAFVIQPETRGAYQSLFHSKAVQKSYEAVAPLHPDCAFPLRYQARLEESDNFMQMRVAAGAPNSETIIDLIGSDPVSGLGHFRLQPITGKKHQLRAHMNALGMPILNDPIYPAHLPAAPDDFSRPLQLLAKTLRFVDPISGELRAFQSERSLDRAIDLN
ncbi:pseudouridine synthase [Ahniella affigens]|uniref:Pseudouridine synthase n=1 Tax=Ahniella affigens TaxID=2021234 RepID=A0A2P1PSE2_9GAMM|nr:pseudouridine synthase [Ahniella affigens]AVP97769.1 pseudouridine synthase [Ahniella affigens]